MCTHTHTQVKALLFLQTTKNLQMSDQAVTNRYTRNSHELKAEEFYSIQK